MIPSPHCSSRQGFSSVLWSNGGFSNCLLLGGAVASAQGAYNLKRAFANCILTRTTVSLKLGTTASSALSSDSYNPGVQTFLQSFSAPCSSSGSSSISSSSSDLRTAFASASHAARRGSSRQVAAHAAAASQPQAAEVAADDAPSTSGSNASPNGAAVAPSSGHAKLALRCAAALIPHPDKLKTGGEDAYFISKDQLKFGVADGVGGWSLSGVDAGLYSKQLMHLAQQSADATGPSAEAPYNILSEAYENVTIQQGSTTACVLCLEGERLHAANVGDSGFMVIRGHEIVFKSPPQQHSFNFPYQLGPRSKGYQTPNDAQLFSVAVREGDMIIAATDGVSDNVFPNEAAAVALTLQKRGCSPKVIADGLAHFARQRAEQTTQMSPFAVAARQQTKHVITGGKLDDITVLFAQCVAAGEEQPNPQSKL